MRILTNKIQDIYYVPKKKKIANLPQFYLVLKLIIFDDIN